MTQARQNDLEASKSKIAFWNVLMETNPNLGTQTVMLCVD